MDPLVGLGVGVMAAGTAANIIGTNKRENAQEAALAAYRAAVEQRTAQQRRNLDRQQRILTGLATDRQRGIGDYISGLSLAQHPGTDDGFQQRQTGALTDIKNLTKGADGTYAYTGAPRTGAEAVQGGISRSRQADLAEALLADYTNRQIDERERAAGNRMALGDLLRANKAGSIQQRFQLAQALRDLNWQKQTAAMQSQLNEASNKGQWLNVLGGLGTQAGGLMMTAGLANGGGGTGSSTLTGDMSLNQTMAEAPMGGWAAAQPGMA